MRPKQEAEGVHTTRCDHVSGSLSAQQTEGLSRGIAAIHAARRFMAARSIHARHRNSCGTPGSASPTVVHPKAFPFEGKVDRAARRMRWTRRKASAFRGSIQRCLGSISHLQSKSVTRRGVYRIPRGGIYHEGVRISDSLKLCGAPAREAPIRSFRTGNHGNYFSSSMLMTSLPS